MTTVWSSADDAIRPLCATATTTTTQTHGRKQGRNVSRQRTQDANPNINNNNNFVPFYTRVQSIIRWTDRDLEHLDPSLPL